MSRFPALAAYAAELDAKAAALQARIDATRELEAKRRHASIPARILSLLKGEGHELIVTKAGQLQAAPDALAWLEKTHRIGVDILKERRAEIIAIIAAEESLGGHCGRRLLNLDDSRLVVGAEVADAVGDGEQPEGTC